MSVGGTLNYRLLGGPLVPLSVTLQAGVELRQAGGGIPARRGRHRPTTSRSASASRWSFPNPVARHPPVARAPRGRRVPEGRRRRRDTETNFGLSGGLELNLLNGFGMHAAYDRVFVERRGRSRRRSASARTTPSGCPACERCAASSLALAAGLPVAGCAADLRRHHARRAGHAGVTGRAAARGRPLQRLEPRRCSASGAWPRSSSRRCARRWPRSSAAARPSPTSRSGRGAGSATCCSRVLTLGIIVPRTVTFEGVVTK